MRITVSLALSVVAASGFIGLAATDDEAGALRGAVTFSTLTTTPRGCTLMTRTTPRPATMRIHATYRRFPPTARRSAAKGPSGNNCGFLAADASRLAALLVGQILPVFSLLAPCEAGASPPLYHRIYERQH